MRKSCKKAALRPSPNNHSYFCLFTLPAQRQHIYDVILENFMCEPKNYQVADRMYYLVLLPWWTVSMKKHEFTPWLLVIDRNDESQVWLSYLSFFLNCSEVWNGSLNCQQMCLRVQKYPSRHGTEMRLDVWKLEWHGTCLGIHWCIICWHSPFMPSDLSSDHQP